MLFRLINDSHIMSVNQCKSKLLTAIIDLTVNIILISRGQMDINPGL